MTLADLTLLARGVKIIRGMDSRDDDVGARVFNIRSIEPCL